MSGERLSVGLSAVISAAICVAGLSACNRRDRVDEAPRPQATEAAAVPANGGVSDRSTPLESTHDAGGQAMRTAGRAEPCSSNDKAGAGICCSVRSSLVYAPVRHRDCDAARCAEHGGRCGWAGFSCPEACIAPARDRGQPCKDVSECESACVAQGDVAKGAPANGRCYDWALALECLNRVRQGRADGTVCIE